MNDDGQLIKKKNLSSKELKTKITVILLDNMVWLIVVAMLFWGIFFVPYFFSARNLTNIVFHSSILALLVLAEALCLMAGNFDLSIESILGFSAMMAPLCFTSWLPWLPWWGGIIVVLATGALIGLANGFFIVKMGINPFLATLAMLIVLRGLNLYILPRSIYDINPIYYFLGGGFLGGFPVAIIVVLVIFLIFWVIMAHREFGRKVLAVGSNKEAAKAAGINTGKVIITTFVLSGLLAAMAGILLTGRQASVTNVMGEGMVFMAMTGAVLGGVSLKGGDGSVIGVLGGVLVLGIIENSLQLLSINVWFIYALKGILIFIAILLDNAKRQLKTRILMR